MSIIFKHHLHKIKLNIISLAIFQLAFASFLISLKGTNEAMAWLIPIYITLPASIVTVFLAERLSPDTISFATLNWFIGSIWFYCLPSIFIFLWKLTQKAKSKYKTVSWIVLVLLILCEIYPALFIAIMILGVIWDILNGNIKIFEY